LVQAHRDEILRIVRLNRGKRAYLFGSTARGDDGESSDIDLLIEFEEGSSLFDLKHVEDDLSGLLGVHVDVVSVGGLLERDEHIRREAIPI
jgi:predicted nucleotidyltransferase